MQIPECVLVDIVDGLNCTWGNWTSLSNCSSDGTCYRERACESKDPGFTGLNKWCSRKDIEFQTCDPEPGKKHSFNESMTQSLHSLCTIKSTRDFVLTILKLK